MRKLDDIPEDGIVFYDIETSAPDPLPEGVADDEKGAKSAAYCILHMVACQVGIDGEPELVETPEQQDRFRRLLLDPEIIKVSYNGVNFDDIVLWRYGYFVEPSNRHDMYLGLKTVAPTLPSYGLKFANCYYFRDWHEPERKLWAWLKRHNYSKQMYKAPKSLLESYCKHDVRQTRNVFCAIWDRLQQPLHWQAYKGLELAMAEPLHEMILLGGEWLSVTDIESRIAQLQQESAQLQRTAKIRYGIKNLGSGQQVTGVLHDQYGVEFDISEAGHFIGRKETWLHLIEPEKTVGVLNPNVTNDYKTEASGRRGFAGSSTHTREIVATFNPDTVDVTKDPTKHIAKLKYEYATRVKIIGYLRSYLNASRYEQLRGNGANSQGEYCRLSAVNSRGCNEKRGNRDKANISKNDQSGSKKEWLVKIPKAYSLSAARTRRLLSSSMFGINFQNQNKQSKVVQLVPPGWLGVWIDSTQIENVVHIWASRDEERRQAYEADVNWSEYVWLCNRVLGGERNRKELEAINTPENPAWSVYKQYKTIKLALNFGMGPDKFAKVTGLSKEAAAEMFEQVHQACPAIRQLQNLIRDRLNIEAYIKDSFGHIYSGRIKEAYKVVSYFIQGMGTGSFPKAMTIANYETIHSLDSAVSRYHPHIRHPFKELYAYGVLTGTTHDECAFRLSLGLPARVILRVIRECMYNMEARFSDKVDGIPLRAKVAFSITNSAEQDEMDHRAEDFEEQLTDRYIYAGKKRWGLRTF